MSLDALLRKKSELQNSLAHFRGEASRLVEATGEALIDDPPRAEGLRARLRSIRDQIESTEAALAVLAPRLRTSEAEGRISRRVSAASEVLDHLDERDRALEDVDRVLKEFGSAYGRLTDAMAAGRRAASIAEDGDSSLGVARVSSRPLESLFSDRALIAYAIRHAMWCHAPTLAQAMGIATFGQGKHRPVAEALGHRIEFEPEALGETLREMAGRGNEQSPRPSNALLSDEGVRVIRVA